MCGPGSGSAQGVDNNGSCHEQLFLSGLCLYFRVMQTDSTMSPPKNPASFFSEGFMAARHKDGYY